MPGAFGDGRTTHLAGRRCIIDAMQTDDADRDVMLPETFLAPSPDAIREGDCLNLAREAARVAPRVAALPRGAQLALALDRAGAPTDGGRG